MSTTESSAPEQAEEREHAAHDDDHAEHMTDRQYVYIAIFLAAVTAAEVATYYFEIPGETFLLLAMMIVKFAAVVMFFMHLKFDSPMFTRAFVTGIVVAVAVYIAVLSTFEFWAS